MLLASLLLRGFRLTDSSIGYILYLDGIATIYLNYGTLEGIVSRPMQEIFQFGETAKITGVPETQLRNWIKGRTIKITPSIRSGSGRGFISLFSREDLYKIAFAKILLGAGQPGTAVTEAIKQAPIRIRRGELLVVTFSLNKSELKWGKPLKEESSPTMARFTIDGAELRKEIDEAIQNYKG